jgi:hypothetical protein
MSFDLLSSVYWEFQWDDIVILLLVCIISKGIGCL